jgi:hypothetical protein
MFEDDSTSVGDVHVVVCSGRVCAAVIFCGSFIELCWKIYQQVGKWKL